MSDGKVRALAPAAHHRMSRTAEHRPTCGHRGHQTHPLLILVPIPIPVRVLVLDEVGHDLTSKPPHKDADAETSSRMCVRAQTCGYN